MVEFGVLGPLRAEDGGRLLDLRGPRHREVLARLLVARGRVVSVTRLVDDLWDDPPEGAVGAVQTFVGALRRALEPDRPPRSPARLLVTAAPGYALRVRPEDTDAGRFETAVDSAGALLAAGRAPEAHAVLDGALALWRGAAYAEVAGAAWARGEAARLEELRLVALERRAEAAIALGRAATAVADLEALVTSAPLREEAWRLLALALYRSGRQGDALAQLRRARDVLRAEAGVDPGPALRELQADVLAQAPHLVPRPAAPPAPAPAPEPDVVGRTDELAALERVAAEVRASGRPRLALVSGVAGTGKTTLARLLTDRLRAAGWATGWGASPEVPGAPTAWPWAQVARELGLPLPEDDDDDADPAAARFRRTRALPAGLAGRGPVLVVLDDLHWADEETLTLLTTVAASAVGPVLLVGTYRSTEVTAPLAAALARAARTTPHRLYLGGLTADQVGELVRVLTHRAMPAAEARAVHRRTGGNPFFVRELVRLWEAGGTAALATVPAGVRDVLRSRLAGLPPTAQTHLRLAAVLGPEPDVDLLVALAGDEDAALDSVEAALLAGFLDEDDGRLRFSHALVQETVYADVPGPRRARWHAAAGRWLAGHRPGDVEAVAHHLVAAGDRADPVEVAPAARAAAERAERRTAVSEAARLWRAALDALDRAGSDDARARLTALTGLARTLAVSGRLDLARQSRATAVEVAEAVGDPVLTARVLGAFDVPAVWTTNDDEALSAHLVAVAERALATLPAGHDAERARLLATIAMERRADPGPRAGAAAREAEEIARRLGDRRLLAVALDGRFLQSFGRAGLAPERARIGEQLVELAAGSPGLVPFEVLGHLVALQARAALADLDAADRHAAAVDALARDHDLPLAGAFTDGYAALRLAVAGRRVEAGTAYRAAAGRLHGTGMTGVEAGLLPLALACLDAPDAAPDGPQGAVVPGHLLEARSCLAALVAVRTGDRTTAGQLYADLLPAADELAAGSGLVCPGPVALYLGLLAGLLGRRDDATAHLRAAIALADRLGAPHWAAAARRALGTPVQPR